MTGCLSVGQSGAPGAEQYSLDVTSPLETVDYILRGRGRKQNWNLCKVTAVMGIQAPSPVYYLQAVTDNNFCLQSEAGLLKYCGVILEVQS